MEGTGITPVMDMNRGYGYGDGFFGGQGIWLFAILALMWGGNGFFGNRGGYGDRCATVEDINNSANFTRLESQVQANGQAIQSTASNLYNGICSLGYEMASKFGATDKQISECCCGINRNIDSVRYENALNTASINANTTAGVQKILDTLATDKISALQGRINSLELQNAVAGVVRYPTSMTYAYNANPFCGYNYGYNCGCGGNI